MRIGGELDEFGSLWEVLASYEGVIAERLRTDHDDEVMPMDHLVHPGDRHWHRARVQPMVFWEGHSVGQGAGAHGCPELLGEGDAGVPPAGAVHLWSENQQRVLRPVDPLGERVEPQSIW